MRLASFLFYQASLGSGNCFTSLLSRSWTGQNITCAILFPFNMVMGLSDIFQQEAKRQSRCLWSMTAVQTKRPNWLVLNVVPTIWQQYPFGIATFTSDKTTVGNDGNGLMTVSSIAIKSYPTSPISLMPCPLIVNNSFAPWHSLSTPHSFIFISLPMMLYPAKSKKVSSIDSSSTLFLTRNDQEFHPTHVWINYKKCVRRAGLDAKTISLHGLRKAFRREVRTTNINQDYAEALMGHVLGGTRENYFNRNDSMEELKREYEKIDFSREGKTAEIEHISDKLQLMETERKVLKEKSKVAEDVIDNMWSVIDDLKKEIETLKKN